MARLAEYMNNLARLLGEIPNTHFVKLIPGSTGLVHAVESEAIPKVRARISSLRNGDASPDVLGYYRAIDKLLRDDNAKGSLIEVGGAEIIAFPGATAPKTADFGLIAQHTVIDGRIRKMGGKGNVVPIMLETNDGFETHCEATRETARELRNYYDGPMLRFSGTGKWQRLESGWTLEKFVISSFVELDERGLIEVVADLRDLPNAGWKDRDVLGELRDVRGDGKDDQ